jgi:predicted ATPase/DNA-binding SARP family transcriptional activator
MTHLWTIDLLGALRARSEARTITRFQTRQTGALLAYLAFYRGRAHPREVLAEVCWPEDEPEIARRKLRVALASLRRQLEPPGVAAGTVILATRTEVQLNPDTTDTDVGGFEAALAAAVVADNGLERAQRLEEAAERYGGALLPGCFEVWVVPERQRLEGMYFLAVAQLVLLLEEEGDLARAMHWARRAVDTDPLREEAHHELMRLLVAAGQPEAALRQYRELERLLEAELGTVPDAAGQRLGALLKPRHPDGRHVPFPVGSAERPLLCIQLRPARISPPAPPIPGTISLVMAEVEGITGRRARVGDSPAEDRGAPIALLRETFRSRGGTERRVTGNSLLYSFARAGDALTAAISGQQALAGYRSPTATEPPRVRIAIHTADVELQGGQLHGPLLHHLTRLTLAAREGQILLSEAAAGVLRSDLPPGVRLIDWGPFRLRTGSPPERLYQVETPDLPAARAFRPKAARAYEGRLPLPLTRFFGREEEIARLSERLLPERADRGWGAGGEGSTAEYLTPGARAPRLVTLTGPGGSGKTRLALETAARLRERWQGAVWFVPLVDLRAADRIPSAIIQAMRLPPAAHLEPLEQVAAALGHRPALLVLDNMEQLLPGGEALVQTLLRRLPLLCVLVTSRRRLDLPGEQEFPVEPLPVPAGGEGVSARVHQPQPNPEDLDALMRYPSVRLFMDRAQSVRPEFHLTRGNAPAVAELCRGLEGIPLALELAAARIGALTLRQILLRLRHRLDLTARRRASADGRHQSLRATLDWSFDLLSSDLRSFCARLSLFRGGWIPEAATEVCQEPRALDYLVLLRQCSLVRTEETCGELRFGMLETVREYAGEQLPEHEQLLLEQRHAEFFRALAEQAEPQLKGSEQAEWLDRLAAEHENLLAGLDWAIREASGSGGAEAAELGLRLASAMGWFWLVRGYLPEAYEYWRRLLDLAGAQARPAVRARAMNAAGSLASWHGKPERRAWLQESVTLMRELGDRTGMADPLNQLGHVTLNDGDYDQAWALFDESRAIYEATGDRQGAAMIQANLGNVAYWRGDVATARAMQETSLATMQELGDWWSVAYALERLGLIALDQREYETARRHYTESLRLYRDLDGRTGIAVCLKGLAVVSAATGHPDRAALLFGAAVAVYEQIGQSGFCAPVHPFYPRDPAIPFAEQLRETHAAAWAAGHALSMEAATALALGECEPAAH